MYIMVMQKLNEDESKKRMFNHIKRLMWKERRKGRGIKVSNDSGITVSDEQEVERFWDNLFCTNGKLALGDKLRCLERV